MHQQHVALGVSLATGAPNCIEGHLKKCVELGVSRAELEEVVATTIGVAGASVVDWRPWNRWKTVAMVSAGLKPSRLWTQPAWASLARVLATSSR